jgi:hypothetical protein
VAAFLLTAVDGTRGQAGVALAADPAHGSVRLYTVVVVAAGQTHILSQLYLEARALSEGSMMPPRRRRTRCRVDSFWML